MVHKAAVWPSSASAPQPPDRFHRPAYIDSSAGQPNSWTPGASSPLGIPPADSGEARNCKPSIRSSDFPPSETFRMTQRPIANSAIVAESSGATAQPEGLISSVRPTRFVIEPREPLDPTESAPAGLVRGSNSARSQTPSLPDLDSNIKMGAQLAHPNVPPLSGRDQQAQLQLIHDDISAMNEQGSETRSSFFRDDKPARLAPLRNRVTPGANASRAAESAPPVEVNIGSVEIVFDQPAVQATPPSPIRPSGFAEFADLRRYAAGSGSSRGR